jgi:esterase/lipase superfamily enzyme
VRRKRYIEEYEKKINISNYDDNEDFEDEYYDDEFYYGGNKEYQTVIRETVTEQFMDIDK